MFKFKKNLPIDKPVKIVLLGDGSTGKSSYYTRIIEYHNPDYKFNKKYKATTDFNLKKLNFKTNNGNIKIFLWDTAGQEKYGGDLRDAYIKGADAAIIMYDVSSRETIKNIGKWLKDIENICNDIPIAVIGNKIDKVENIKSLDHVKIRDSRLRSLYNGSFIKNFLVSVKENTKYEEGGFIFSAKINDEGILLPIESLLSEVYGKVININKDEDINKDEYVIKNNKKRKINIDF
jgi:GTP-binding nuclear protein Ran